MRIRIYSRTTPDDPETGYQDDLELIGEHGKVKARFKCSACPNPYKPSDPKIRWGDYYGWLAPGTYTWRVYHSQKYGKCLLLNGGGECKSRVPNWRHGDRPILKQVLVHAGGHKCQNPEWRGSAGCVTLHRNWWGHFINHFKDKDKGTLEIIDARGTGNKKEGTMGRFRVGLGIKKAIKTALGAGLATAAATSVAPLMTGPAGDAVTTGADSLVTAVATAATTASIEPPDLPITAIVTVATWAIKFFAGWIKHRK